MSTEIAGHAQEATNSSILSETATITGSPQNSTFTTNGSSAPSPEFPRTIPEANAARTLVLCFDGTGDQYVFDLSFIVRNVMLFLRLGLTLMCVG